MRKMFLSLVAVVTLACLSVSAQEQKNKTKVDGSGNVVTKEVSVQPFDQLNVGGVFSVQLSQGSKEEVKIEADDNLQEYFEVKNDGSQLSVTMKKDVNINSKKKMKVYITFKKLKSLHLKTVGDVSSNGTLAFGDLEIDNKSVGSIDLKLTAQTVTINNKSVGDVSLTGNADKVVIKNKSVGSINAGEFVVQTLDIDNDGIGSAEVNAAKEIKVKDSFLGKVTNRGAAVIKRTNKVSI